MIKYRADFLQIKIEPVEIARESDRFVYPGDGEQRYAKETRFYVYCNTQSEAKKAIKAWATKKYEDACEQVNRYHEYLKKIEEFE